MMKVRKVWGVLLVAVALIMGSCSKESEEPMPDPKFEWTTAVATDVPVFVVPDTQVEIAYAAEHVQSVSKSRPRPMPKQKLRSPSR